MAFSRIQGHKVVLLQSKRQKGRVIQQKLHTFESFSDAKQTVDSDLKWKILCDTIRLQFGIKFNKTQLRQNIRDKIKDTDLDESSPIDDAAIQILHFLKNLQPPLYPKQKRVLETAKNNLLELSKTINQKLPLLEEDEMLSLQYDQSAVECLHKGLGHYEQGKWDEAKMAFLEGLKNAPDHVDLLVHAGIVEFLDENYSLALNYYNKAADIGKRFIDAMIESDPEAYVKRIDLGKWAADKICEWADECPDLNTDKCKTCERFPVNQKTELYSHLKFRPFFRSLTNKAQAQMKLRQFREAIDTLKLCQEYQDLCGTYNQIGICYLNLGDIENAEKWYNELLWDEAYYIKALIAFLAGKLQDSIKYLLTGIIKNPHIALMLIGADRPEKMRYVGTVLPDRIEASEFIHEKGHLFKPNKDFNNLVRCILDHDEISELLKELEEAKEKRKKDQNHHMRDYHWELLHGDMNSGFLERYVPELMNRLNDKDRDYWKPKENDVLEVEVAQKKQQNWLVRLKENNKELYFRPKTYLEHVQDQDTIRICVFKSWFYKRRLFVSGEILQ